MVRVGFGPTQLGFLARLHECFMRLIALSFPFPSVHARPKLECKLQVVSSKHTLWMFRSRFMSEASKTHLSAHYRSLELAFASAVSDTTTRNGPELC